MDTITQLRALAATLRDIDARHSPGALIRPWRDRADLLDAAAAELSQLSEFVREHLDGVRWDIKRVLQPTPPTLCPKCKGIADDEASCVECAGMGAIVGDETKGAAG